jgi:hypothetical protein
MTLEALVGGNISNFILIPRLHLYLCF